MGDKQVDLSKISVGPAELYFPNDEYVGKTLGDTNVEYGIEVFTVETEEDGPVDELIISDALTVTVPVAYTDVKTLAKVLPWATLEEDGDDAKLVVGKAIGTRLSEHAKTLRLHPIAAGDDKDFDVNIHLAFPRPGPISFTYNRSGQRVANITFVAIPDKTKDPGEDYFVIGDPDIDASATISTKHTVAVGDTDPAIVVALTGDTFVSGANNVANWTFTAGSTTLTLGGVHKTGDREVIVVLSGTAEAGSFDLQADADALDGTDPSNVMTVIVA